MNERSIIADLLASLRPDDVFYDIGANIGIYTCLVGKVLSNGSVVAFEPHPANVERLRRNAKLNEVALTTYPLALSDSDDILSLAEHESGTSGAGAHGFDVTNSGVMSEKTTQSTNTLQVAVRNGDALIEENKIPRPNILKIDVEGAEQAVLDGLKRAIAESTCRLVYCEVHEETSTEKLCETLKLSGFEVSSLGTRGTETFLRAEKQESE